MTNSVWGSFGANVPTREVFATETFTTLRALTNPRSNAQITINVDGGITKGDGLGGIFYYDPSSVLVDDSVSVIAPASGIGRWIRRDIVPGYNNFRKNAIINGGMEIAQRGTNFPAIAHTNYCLDRYKYIKVGAYVHTVSQDNDAPTLVQAGQLFLNSFRFNLTTPQDILGVNDTCAIEQDIEGYNFRSLAQRPLTVSFWVKATLPGNYAVALGNSIFDRAVVQAFTINLANTWEKKSLTFPASPITGSWLYTNGVGLGVKIVLATGVNNYAVAPNVWQVGNASGLAGQINGVQTGATDFRFTGLQVESGSIATEFERRTIQEELILCQRYYQKSFRQITSPAQNVGLGKGEEEIQAVSAGATGMIFYIRLPVVMRIDPPTVITYNPSGNNAEVRNVDRGLDCSGTIKANGGDRGFTIFTTGNPGNVIGDRLNVNWTASAEL